jgi:hypothetical protein
MPPAITTISPSSTCVALNAFEDDVDADVDVDAVVVVVVVVVAVDNEEFVGTAGRAYGLMIVVVGFEERGSGGGGG